MYIQVTAMINHDNIINVCLMLIEAFLNVN